MHSAPPITFMACNRSPIDASFAGRARLAIFASRPCSAFISFRCFLAVFDKRKISHGFGVRLLRSFRNDSSHSLASELMRSSARARAAVKTERGTRPDGHPITAMGLRPFDCAAFPRMRANRIEAAITVASQSKG